MGPRGCPRISPKPLRAGDKQGWRSSALLVLDSHLHTWGWSGECGGVSAVNLGCDPAERRAGLGVSWDAPVSRAPHQPLTPAEERKVLSLVSKHGPDKLYQVTSNISGSRELDLTLLRGQIVALLQSSDTKGNTSRWLVDAGGTVGTVGSLSSAWHRGQVHLNHSLSWMKQQAVLSCALLCSLPGCAQPRAT